MKIKTIERFFFPGRSLNKYENEAWFLISQGVDEGVRILSPHLQRVDTESHALAMYTELACFYLHWTSRSAHALKTDKLFQSISQNLIRKLIVWPSFVLGISNDEDRMFEFSNDFVAIVNAHELRYVEVIRTDGDLFPTLAREVFRAVSSNLDEDSRYSMAVFEEFLRAVLSRMQHGGFERLD